MNFFDQIALTVAFVVPVGAVIAVWLSQDGMIRTSRAVLAAMLIVSLASATSGEWHGASFEQGEASLLAFMVGWLGFLFSLMTGFVVFAKTKRSGVDPAVPDSEL
jgi:hypothetical protein